MEKFQIQERTVHQFPNVIGVSVRCTQQRSSAMNYFLSLFADSPWVLLQRPAAAPQRPVRGHVQEIRQGRWRHPSQGTRARPRAAVARR